MLTIDVNWDMRGPVSWTQEDDEFGRVWVKRVQLPNGTLRVVEVRAVV